MTPFSPSRPPRVLIIEPDTLLAATLVDLLECHEFDVVEACHLRKARDILDAGPIDIVVCHPTTPDCPRPGDLFEALARYPGKTIVVMTARPAGEVRGLTDEMVLLRQPFGATEFLRALGSFKGSASMRA